MSTTTKLELFSSTPHPQSRLLGTSDINYSRCFTIEFENDLTAEQREELPSVLGNSLLWEAHLEDWKRPGDWFLLRSPKPGVTDNMAHVAQMSLAQWGHKAKVKTAELYFFHGPKDLTAAKKILGNDLIDTFKELSPGESPFFEVDHPEEKPIQIERIDLTAPGAYEQCDQRGLGLSRLELDLLKDYATKRGEALTDVELEIMAQSWSEHCKHKLFAATIVDGSRTIKGLFKTFIKGATDTIIKERRLDWTMSLFVDNAGIVRFGDGIDLAFKMETHNGPSILDPYGGALTGILGVNRDILGTGMGARCVANLDIFCVGQGEEKWNDPDIADVLAPETLLRGIHRGVEDGGNKSGIPTVAGAMYFDGHYKARPLVFCGTLGVLPRELPGCDKPYEKKAEVGDYVVVIGGAVGRDGIHGATLSSQTMSQETPPQMVQIGDPFTQKRINDFLIEARARGLYRAITDNGAGGLSSSVGEMAEDTHGARIDLARCPLKYPGLDPWEIMVSESQERMTLAVDPAKWPAFLKLGEFYQVNPTHLGEFTDSGFLEIHYNNERVAKLEMDFIHQGTPEITLVADRTAANSELVPAFSQLKKRFVGADFASEVKDILLCLLSSPTIRKKDYWTRQYDSGVQAATLACGSHSNAGVIALAPHGGGDAQAVTLSVGMAPNFAHLSGRHLGQLALDEAVRNTIAAGADPDKIALMDNFCWPNPEGEPAKVALLLDAAEGLHDLAISYGMPFISGKDSMKNDYRGIDSAGEKKKYSTLPTVLVSALGYIPDNRKIPSSSFPSEPRVLLHLGKMGTALGGSQYWRVANCQEELPELPDATTMETYREVAKLIAEGAIDAIHDVSEGGSLVALCEALFENNMGAICHLPDNEFGHFFNEGPGQFIVAASFDKWEHIVDRLGHRHCRRMGETSIKPLLCLGEVEIPIPLLKAAWSTPWE